MESAIDTGSNETSAVSMDTSETPKITVFDTCSNIDWQIFSIKRNTNQVGRLPDAVLTPPLNLNRWSQSKQNNDNYNDIFMGNIQKLFGTCDERKVKLFFRLRINPMMVAKNPEIIDQFLQENEMYARFIVLDLQGNTNQLYWNDFSRHKDCVKSMVSVLGGRVVGALVTKRNNEEEQSDYDSLLRELKMMNLEVETRMKEHLFDSIELQMIKKFTKFTIQLGQQSDSFKDTRKFILRLYKSCQSVDPFTKYRLENTLNCEEFGELYKAFTLQQIYKKSSTDNSEAKKAKITSTRPDIFKSRPAMEKLQPTVCVDLSWTEKMSEKEVSKLVSQLARLHGANKHTQRRTRVLFTGCVEDSFLHKELLRKFDENLLKWGNCYFIKKSYNNTVPDGYNMIYLSPDSETPLSDADFGQNSCFIIGGLVDETVQTKLSLTKADAEGIQTRRFPIEEHMQVPVGSNVRPALAINQVGEILFKKINEDDCNKPGVKVTWKEIFDQVLPARYGLS